MNNIAYIGIGSNVGEKLENCNSALIKIAGLKETRIVAASDWYKNKAMTLNPKEKQPDFINGVVKIETLLDPDTLLGNLKEVEKMLGRKPTEKKWLPRTIDLDILFFNDEIIDSDILKIPHPKLHKRSFVLRPLCDIEPKLIHPTLKITAEELLSKL